MRAKSQQSSNDACETALPNALSKIPDADSKRESYD